MNDSIKFKLSKNKPAIWLADKFKIDNNVSISIKIFRSTKKDKKNINHIWQFELFLCNNDPCLNVNSDNKQIDTKLISDIKNKLENNELPINKNQKQLYLEIINLIILQTLLFDFNDTNEKNEIDVDLKYIKKIYDDYFNNNRDYQKIINDDKFLSYIAKGDNRDKILEINCESFKQMIHEYEQNLNNNDFKEHN